MGYKAQVNPREINCFYAQKGMRERIEWDGEIYKVLNTNISFSKEEILKELKNNPNAFSPNVVLRPLYQQKMLPNIAYVGGPGELAYWLEYKRMFEAHSIPFPVLMPRNFIVYIDAASSERIEKLGITIDDLFLETDSLLKKFIQSTNDNFSLDGYKEKITTVFNELKNSIEPIDKSILSSADAEKQKALNSISILEQKLIKALKNKSEIEIGQLKKVKEKILPGNQLQERTENLSTYFIKNPEFIATIMEAIQKSGSENKGLLIIREA